ncbi:fatty acid desaturase family protein [Legionella drozanskii]|uniref:Fatty acid desaturase n=1 Tax=Legionella drozanskii LLAP-1 TaxID=1212489 RepID=A0A0W0SXS2_9GAMM|nr:fatty acid desaturase [Legionella drozanskii]KTC88167.1 Fatty acid desaturase [Legionella drozanskii LLAP-1]
MQTIFFRQRERTSRPLHKLIFIVFTYIFLALMYSHNLLANLLIAFILGFILAGGLNLAHECLHQTYLKNRFLNTQIGRFFSAILLINFTLYKEHHLQHHKYVGTEKDTETKIEFKSLAHYIFFITGLPFAFAKISKTLNVLLQIYPYYIDGVKKKKRALWDSLFICVLLVLFFSFTLLFPRIMFYCYWLPLLFSYMWILFFGLPEHLDCNHVPDFYSESRSILSNYIVRLFLWNGNFHAEHHLYPGLAGSGLQKLFKKNIDSVFYQEKSYLYWHIRLIKKLINIKNKGKTNLCQNC